MASNQQLNSVEIRVSSQLVIKTDTHLENSVFVLSLI